MFLLLCLASCVDPETCQVCMSLVGAVREMVKEGKTEIEISDRAQSVCDAMPVAGRAVCQSSIIGNMDVIVDWIEQFDGVFNICNKLNLCRVPPRPVARPVALNGADAVALSEEEYNGLKCKVCTKVMDFVEGVLSDTKIQKTIAQMTEKLCQKEENALLRELCLFIVDNYIPKLIQWIESGLEKFDFCVKIGYCTANAIRPRLAVESIAEENFDQCQVCRTVVGWASNLMKQGGIGASFASSYLSGMCSGNAIATALCKAIVSQFVPRIIELLNAGLSEVNVCRSLRLCASNYGYFPALPPGVQLLPAEENFDACGMCTRVMSAVEDAMSAGAAGTSAIRSAAAAFCSTQPALSGVCHVVIDLYLPQVIQLLERGVNPSAACSAIRLCASNWFWEKKYEKPIKGILIGTSLDPRRKTEANLDLCGVCQTVGNFLYSQMQKGSLGSSAATMLAQSFCAGQPWILVLCNVLVGQFMPELLEGLGQGLKGLSLCRRVGVCSSNGLNALPDSFGVPVTLPYYYEPTFPVPLDRYTK